MRILLAGVLAAAAAFLQAPAPQPPPSASLVLSGHVLTGSGPDARPVRHARVTLNGGALKSERIADTDTTGSYRFDRLAPGNYRVSVRKAGFVTVTADATPDATLTMVHGGAIEGLVTSERVGNGVDGSGVSAGDSSTGHDVLAAGGCIEDPRAETEASSVSAGPNGCTT